VNDLTLGRPGWSPTATTRLAAVIGMPIRHSLSPVIHNAAFRALDLDWVFAALPVAEGSAAVALAGMKALGIDGLSVTMPHKQDVADAVDRLTDDARALRAVNCVVRDGDELVGHNTDGPGFLAGLHAAAEFAPAGRSCVVLGAGGAARAVVLALARAGAAEVTVVNRTASRAEAAAALAGPAGAVGDVDAIRTADLVVNATSVGMGAEVGDVDGPAPFDTDLLHEGQVVAELVVHPVDTPLLLRAAARDAVPVGGIGMLVHQAAIAFTLWTGVEAPVEVMTEAAEARLR
jgi:shikimate dehydrogenase